MENNKKSLQFTALIKNFRGFLFKKKKRKLKIELDEEKTSESDFFRTMKNMIISNLKKEYVIKYFKKPISLRTKLENRSISEYLCLNEKNVFFKNMKNFGIYKLYNMVKFLSIEQYKKGDFIFQYKENANKFSIILEGKISLNLPYFHKKLISIKDFLDYFFSIKKNYPKIFPLVEQKNKNILDNFEKLKLSNYDINSLSDINQDNKREFYVQVSQKVCEINEGNSFGDIAVLYNLPQNFNVISENNVNLLTMVKSDYMKILRPIIENEILVKEFTKLRKFSYMFNSWSNFSLGQIMNYFIPVKFIKKEILYNQKDFSDSFYIVHEGIFDVYCELSLSDFSKYKNYIIKNNKNILDWIKEEKEKKKINIDGIIEHINEMKEINKYPKDKEVLDKNISYIKKRMLEKEEGNSQHLINIKLNEDILTEKNSNIKVKLFTLKKNDFLGVIDSLELKSRFFTVECSSDRGELNKVRILDFLVFIAFNHGLDLDNIYKYIKEKKRDLVERVYKNLDIHFNNNKRIIKNIYMLAFSSLDKRQNIIHKENEYTIKNMKNLYIDSEGNNNLIDRIRKSINYKKKVYSVTQPDNFITKSFQKIKKKEEEIKNNILDINKFYIKTENDTSKIKFQLRKKEEIINNKKTKTQANLSSNNLSKSYSNNNKQKEYEIKDKRNHNLKKQRKINSATIPLKEDKFFLENEDNFRSKYFSINIAPVMYDKKFKLIKYRDLSFDNKLEKYLTNSLGIYNTKREKLQKKILDYKNNSKTKTQIKKLERRKILYSKYINNKQKNRPKILSAYISNTKNITKKNKDNDFISLIKYLDKSKRDDIYKNINS